MATKKKNKYLESISKSASKIESNKEKYAQKEQYDEDTLFGSARSSISENRLRESNNIGESPYKNLSIIRANRQKEEEEAQGSIFDIARKNIASGAASYNRAEKSYMDSLPNDAYRFAYQQSKNTDGVYVSPYFSKGIEGKEKLKYNNDEWNRLSEGERKGYLEWAQQELDKESKKKKPNLERDNKYLNYAMSILNETNQTVRTIGDTHNISGNLFRAFVPDRLEDALGMNKESADTFNKDQELQIMLNMMPEEVRQYLTTGMVPLLRENQELKTPAAIKEYLSNYYSDDMVDKLSKYARKVENIQRQQERNFDIERKMDNPFYATVVAPMRQVGTDLLVKPFAGAVDLVRASSEANKGLYGEFDPLQTEAQRMAQDARYINESINEGLGKGGRFVYGTAVSAAESTIRTYLATTGASGISKMMPFVNAETASKVLLTGMMSTAVFNDDLNENIQKGMPLEDAVSSAMVHSIFESLFEEISLDKLGYFQEAPVLRSKKEFVKQLMKAGFVEGSEEAFTDIANELYDHYVGNYDYSEYKAFKDKYLAENPDATDAEIWWNFTKQFSWQVAQSFAGGALSSFALSSTKGMNALRRGETYIQNGKNVTEADYIRMNSFVEEMAAVNPSIMNQLTEATEGGIEARKGFVKMVTEEYSEKFNKAIEQADTKDKLNIVMNNANAALHGAISEDTFNKYNAKLVELGETPADYNTFVQNRAKTNAETTFSDLAYGKGDTAISRNIVEASKSIAETQENADMDESVREEAIKKLTEKVETNVKKAEEMVARYAEMGVPMDSPEVRQFESVLGLQNMAQMYSAGKLAAQNLNLPATAQKSGKLYQVKQNSAEAKRVFKKDYTHMIEATYDEVKNSPAYALGKVVSRMTGWNIGFYKSDRKGIGNGAIDPSRKTIYVDLNSGVSGAHYAVGETFSHETTHWIRVENENGYQRLREFVRNDIGEKAFESLVREHIRNEMGEETFEALVKKHMEQDENLSREDAEEKVFKEAGEEAVDRAEEEVVAEACQKMLENSEVFKKYAAQDLEGAKTLLQRLVDFIRKLREAFKGSLNNEATRLIEDLEGLQKEWDAALSEAIGEKNAEMSQEAAEGILENNPKAAEEIVGTELVTDDSVKSSQRLNGELMEKAEKEWKKVGKDLGISYRDFYNAVSLCNTVAQRMKTDLAPYLPEDNPGKVEVGNASYGRSMENALVCIRSIVNNDFTDMVSEELGRPLTVEEQLVASQILQIVNSRPECNYCYVATDRRAYRASFGTYFNQYSNVYDKVAQNREAFSKDLPGAEKRMEAVRVDSGDKNNGTGVVAQAYAEFLNGRKNTPDMRKRFLAWVKSAVNGEKPISLKDLSSAKMRDAAREDSAKKWFIYDSENYAQKATWAKKTSRTLKINGEKYVADYVSYNGSILKWSDDLVKKLNSEFGMRMYSFSDYVPAFLLENMQMIIDASLRGLKVLAYTKDCGFAEAFADTGAGINISLFGTLSAQAQKDENLNRLREQYKKTNSDADRKAYLSALDKYVVKDGIGGKDGMMGANWERATSLRKSYGNVGTVFVATNDDLVEWALANPDIDVVIPYHLVRTGEEVASFFNYKNYKAAQEDKKQKEWATGNLKAVPPTVHKNSLELYKKALADNKLTARFSDYIDNPNYMKLVNETRMSYEQLQPVQPVFDQETIMRELGRIKDEGQYGLMPGFKTKAEQDAFIENQNLVGQAVDAIGEWNESGKKPIDDTKYSSRLAEESLEAADDSEKEMLTGNDVLYSRRVEDKKTLDFLNNQDYITTYRSFQIINGGLYSPMNQGREGYESKLGEWEESTEIKDFDEAVKNGILVPKKNGGYDYNLKAGKNTTSGKNRTTRAAYNPYLHSSNSVLNDQFAAAYDRPNLVVVECHVPKSEEARPYRAKNATDPVGWKEWKSGKASTELAKSGGEARGVFLSRWMMPVRILPYSEVAQMYKDALEGTDITIAWNVVPPGLRHELENIGVPIDYSYKNGSVTFENVFPDEADKVSGTTKYSSRGTERDSEYMSAVNSGDMETAQRLVDEAAKEAGYTEEFYHGSHAKFNSFDLDKSKFGNSGYGIYLGGRMVAAEFGGDDIIRLYVNPDRIARSDTHSVTTRQFQSALKRLGLSAKDTYKWYVDSASEYVSKRDDWRLAYDLQDWAKQKKKLSPSEILSVLQEELNLDGMQNRRELVLWDNKLLKSADPVTYDDNGNVIPLSERFNKESEDIRYASRGLAEGLSDEEIERIKEKKRKNMTDRKILRDVGEKLSEKDFYALYSAHKLDLRKMGNIPEQIDSIKGEGFRGNAGFGHNIVPASIDNIQRYTLDDRREYLKQFGLSDESIEEGIKRLKESGKGVWSGDTYFPEVNWTQRAYGGRKGDTVLFVPEHFTENDRAKVKNGFKPFNYEVVVVERDFQPYYELYSRAYDEAKKADDLGIRFSSRDSSGRELTEAQQEYFKDSKVRDEDGNLKTMWHGTTSGGFTEFDSELSSGMFFFTDSQDVAQGYSGTQRIFAPSREMTLEELQARFYNEITETKNGYRVRTGGLKDSYKTFKTLDELNEFMQEEYPEIFEEGFETNYEAYLNITNPLEVDANGSAFDEISVEWSKDLQTTEDVANYAKENGYDGVIISNISDSGINNDFMGNASEPSTVAIAFDSNQIKSVNNENPTESDDIRYSLRDLANSESEIIVNALANDEALVESLGAKQSIEAYAREYNKLKDMEQQAIEISKQLQKKGTTPSEREVLLKKMVRLDRAILNKTTELTEMRNQRVIRDLLVNEWDKRDTMVAAGRAEERLQTRKALEEKYGKELSELKAKNKAQQKAIRDRQKSKHLKENIIKKTRDIMKRIATPTEKKHVPTVLVKPISELIEAIDYWTPKEGRPVTKTSEQLWSRFQNFKNAVEELQTETDKAAEAIKDRFDPDFLNDVNQISKYVTEQGIDNVNDMNVENLEALDSILTELNHIIKTANDMFSRSRFKTADELRQVTKEDLNKRKGLKEGKSDARGNFVRRTNAGMADAYAWAEYAGEGAKEIVNMLSKAYNRKINLIRQATEYTEDVLKPVKKDLKKWEKDEKTFKLESGKELKLNVRTMLDIYLLSKREQGYQHLISDSVSERLEKEAAMANGEDVTFYNGGGIRVKDRKGKFRTLMKFTQSDLNQVIDYLKTVPNAIEVAEKLQKFISTEATAWGNKASNDLYGIVKYTEENYWPISTSDITNADNGTGQSVSTNVDMNKIKNYGFTKALQQNAKNGVDVDDFLNVFSKHIDEMSSYGELLPALTDAMRWWNSRTDSEDNRDERIKDLMASKIGTDMANVFNSIIIGLNGGTKTQDSLASWIRSLRGKVKAAAIAFNPRVVVQQPFSYTRAAAVIEKKYLTKALTMVPAVKEAQEHSAIAWLKHQGFHSSGIGPSMKKLVTGDGTAMENLVEKTMAPAGWADDITWGTLWNAAKLKVEDTQKNLEKGSQEYFDAIEDVFDEIINRTQVVETPLTQSPWMKSNMGTLYMSFMNEPVKTYSMVMTAIDKVIRDPHNAEARRQLYNAAGTFMVSGFALALAQSLVDAARDDDKELSYWEKYVEKYRDNALDNVNPLTYLPLIKDAWSVAQGYSSKDLTSQGTNEVINATKELIKVAKGESKHTLWGQAEIMARAYSYMSGVPVSNAMRIFKSVGGNMLGYDFFRSTDYTKSELGRNVVLELREGNTEQAEKYFNQLQKKVGEDEDPYKYISDYLAKRDDDADIGARKFLEDANSLEEYAQKIVSKYNAEYVTLDVATDSIRKAAREDLKEEAAENGTKYKNTISSGNTAGTLWNGSDINRALENGDIVEAQKLIDKINEGYKKQENNTTAKKSVSDYWKPKYLAASGAERDKIARMLYSLKNNGKQMFSAKDIQKWVSDANKKK